MSNVRPQLWISFTALALAGCASWHRTGPTAQLPPAHPKTVRAHLKSGSTLVIENAYVIGDSLVGNVPGKLPFDPVRHRDRIKAGPRVAVALADIERIDVKKVNPWRTTAFIVVLGGIVFVVGIGMALSDGFIWTSY
jgi:hypothetical protein